MFTVDFVPKLKRTYEKGKLKINITCVHKCDLNESHALQ